MATTLAVPRTLPLYPGLIGKVALLSGASSRMGSETARYLAANLVQVIVSGRNREALNRLVEKIEAAGGSAMAIVADCNDPAQVEAMRHTLEQRFGGVDLLIAYAGGGSRFEPVVDLPEEKWDQVMDPNLKSKFLMVKSFLPGMKRRGGGAIVLKGTSSARADSGATLPFSCSRPGITNLIRKLARQLGPDRIRVNAIAPSVAVNEKMEPFLTEEQREPMMQSFSTPRIGKPFDVAAATLFLCSEASSWITGKTLYIAGGEVMG